RADSLSLQTLREAGIDPRAIIAWAARTAGLEVPARCTPQQVLTVFDWSRVNRGAVNLPENPLVALH
ncbi:MAG TPA: hypothetical protein VHO25_25530, partial [Polyangiaceae bacterium]|nr:hypothetical protein [Polyangiaceae bacterium]